MGTQPPPPKKGAEPPPQFSTHFYCGQTARCIKMPLGMEVGLSPADFVFDGDPAPSPKKGAEPLPNFRPMSIAANGCMDQDATWCRGRPWPIRHCVRWGPIHPPQKGGRAPAPIFGPCLLWPNCWIDQDGTWHGGGPWSRPHCARWGHSSPPPKKGQSPQFLAHVYCGQMAGWIKTALNWYGFTTDVDLGPGYFVLDGFPAISESGTAAPSFRPMPIVTTVAHLSYC